MTHISQSEKGLHTEQFLRMQTFLRLAYMYHVLRIPLKGAPVMSFRHHNNNQIIQMFTINMNLPVSCKIIAKQTGLGILAGQTPRSSSITEFIYIYMYIYHCFHSYDWEETLVFTVIGLYRPIHGPCIHQCKSFACTFVNLPESVKIFTGNSLGLGFVGEFTNVSGICGISGEMTLLTLPVEFLI